MQPNHKSGVQFYTTSTSLENRENLIYYLHTTLMVRKHFTKNRLYVTTEMLDWLDADHVRRLLEEEKLTFEQLSTRLKVDYPDHKTGLSERNLKRFCALNSIRRHIPISSTDLDNYVSEAIEEVGGTYGRKMMTGHLQNKLQSTMSERRVGQSLKRVHPYYHKNRQLGIQNQVNPSSYHAPYFGYNLHLDQNEKLEMFGIVYVAAIDGKSAYVTNCTVMPRKNNIAIYRDVLMKTIIEIELFEQIIVDGGNEFFLTLFMQDYYSPYRTSSRAPYKQVTSTKNNRIERWWGELNERVNYPIKYCLIDFEREDRPFFIDRSIPHHIFSINAVVAPIAVHGSRLTMDAWNSHSIPGSGKPKDYLPHSKTIRLNDEQVVDETQAVTLYEENNGSLTREHTYGQDLLSEYPAYVVKRDEEFWNSILPNIGTIAEIFGSMANHKYELLQGALKEHITLSEKYYNAINS